jgi:hypothetical protein
MPTLLHHSTSGRALRRALLALALAGTVSLPQPVLASSADQAKRIHDRIAGVPPDGATLTQMQADIDGGDALAAAFRAIDDPGFYNVTLKNFAAPWTNRDDDVFVPLNDYTATIIGMVRDDADFRDILSADVVYVGSGSGIPAYSTTSNAHYEALENAGTDLSTNLQPQAQSSLMGIPSAATAGILTSRAASKAFFILGTNRAMFRFTMKNHLCHDMEQVLEVTRAPDRIRQDVSRSPGGDARIFLNNCIGCHSGMDPLAQGFAYYNYEIDRDNDPTGENGQLRYNDTGTIDPVTGTRVTAKYFNNNTTFAEGYITTDDHWDNYWRAGPNSLLGWDPALPGSGNGAKSLGQELSHSTAFAQCQVEKVFENVCLRAPSDAADRAAVDSMVTSFAGAGYNLKQVFAESAVYCMGN